MANRYTRALKQIKDSTLDEKLKLLEDLPTNNTTGIFVDTPGQYQPQEVIPGDIDSPLNLEQDGDGSPTYDGTDTSGLFQADGTIRSVEPPGDTSYVLGPMSSMYYGWGGFTQIGYIRQSDRKMVNLARITGTIEGWDGESNFTSYGQLTLEQAVWFRDQSKSDYQAFYPGPPSGGSDEYGRYLSQIIDTGKSVVEIIRAIFTPGTNKGFDPSDVFSSILGLILRSDDPSFMDALKSLGVAGKVYLGYLTNLLGDTIDNEFLGQDYVNDSFANMELGYDNNGKLISSVGDNVIGSGQYPTYNPTTNEIELNFNYDFKSNVEEFKDKEGLHGGLAGEIQKGVYNALSPYSVDAQVSMGSYNPLGPLSGAVFGTLINAAKGLGGGKPTPGKITISPQQLQQINPQAYNQLVNSGNVPSDAVDKPSQNKQVPPDGAEVDPEKAIESLKQKLPADKRAQVDFQQTMSMDNFNKLSQSDQNKVMNALQDRHKSRRDGSNFKDAPKYMRDRFKASAKEAGKTKFKDGYMIDKDPNTGKTRKTPIFSTIPGMSSVLAMSNEPSGKLLTESQKRALRNVKKPVKVKEIPTKVKVKPTSRKNKTVGVDMMKVPDTPKQYKPQIDIWTKEDYAANVRASQEKKNEVLELLGAAEHHWTHLTEDSRKKKQEKVNEMMSAEYDKQMEDMYEKYVSKQNKLDKTVSALRQKKKYLSDSDTSVAKKKTFTKWYDSVDSTTADKIISDAKIETKDQIMELVVAEFNRLRLQEGMSSKGFEYIYGLAVNNIVSQYRIDSKFASDLLHSSADATDYEFGPGYPGSHINSIGDYQVDSSRLVNVNAYYDSTFGSASGSGSAFTLNTVDGAGAASRASLQAALGITLPTGIPNGSLTGTPTEGSAVQRTFTGAKPGNIINFTWGFTSTEKGLDPEIKVDDYAFVAISGRTTKFVSILANGDVKGGAFKYRLNASDIDADGNVKVSIGVVDVHDKIYNTTLRVTSFGSLYAGDLGSVGDTTDAADLGMPVKPPKKGDEIALDTIPYEPPSPGPGGYKPPGSYDPNKFYNLDNKTPMPSPNLPQTGPGQSSIPDGTEVAASYPTTNTPLDKVGGFKGIPKGKGIYPMDKDGNLYNPQTGLPIKKAGKKQPKTMVAHHEPQGEVLSEKKRLKSVKDFSNYPGKPSPMGWPEEEPPKTINGYHPDLVDGKEVSNRYNRLDAISAKAMPSTGNPYIDKKVKAAAARIKEEAKITNKMSAFKKPTDVAPEYPKDPPPQMVNGYHPKYGKQYKHDKLDPQSAEAMPPTGNPEVDANIKKATNAKEKLRKLKTLKGKG